jgi:hypothetical protein
MKKIFAILMIIGFTVPAIGQISPFLEKGKSGFGILAGGDEGYSFKGLAGSVGLSLKGVLDAEFLVNYDMYDQYLEELNTDKAASTGYTGILTWWFLRKAPIPQLEVNVGLKGAYEYFTYSNFTWDNVIPGSGGEYTGYMGGQLGLDARIKINLTDSWSVMPGYWAVYQLGTEKWKTDGVEESGPYSGIVSNLSLAVAKKFSQGSSLYLTTYHFNDTYDNYAYYALLLGYVIPLK